MTLDRAGFNGWGSAKPNFWELGSGAAVVTPSTGNIDPNKTPKSGLKLVLFLALGVAAGETFKLARQHQLNGKMFLAVSSGVGSIILLTVIFMLIDRAIRKAKLKRQV